MALRWQMLLTAKSIDEARHSLLMSAYVKIPLQAHFANKDDWCTPQVVDAFEKGMKAAGKSLATQAFTDLVQPLNRLKEEADNQGGFGWGKVTPRGSPSPIRRAARRWTSARTCRPICRISVWPDRGRSRWAKCRRRGS